MQDEGIYDETDVIHRSVIYIKLEIYENLQALKYKMLEKP